MTNMDSAGPAPVQPVAGWQIRLSWTPAPGIVHPRESYGTADDRDEAVLYAWREWNTRHADLTLTGVHIRQLPDGGWADLEPELPCCGQLPVAGTGWISGACAMTGVGA